jgi:3-oxoacyl-[acyl-carrier protein] reductase
LREEGFKMRLENKVAVITGGGSGIGRATSYLFAREGAKIVVSDIDNRGGEETEKEIKSTGGQASFVHVDVSKAVDLKNLVGETLDTFGKIDILFNNAGITSTSLIEETDELAWDQVFAVNVRGIFLGVKYAAPEMRKAGGGVIINTASVTAFKPRRFAGAYSSTKGAVVTLTRQLALELAAANIRVNCISPGITATPLMQRSQTRLTGPEQEQRAREASARAELTTVPLGKLAGICKPEDIANAALFLASDESSMVTGASIDVGWLGWMGC